MTQFRAQQLQRAAVITSDAAAIDAARHAMIISGNNSGKERGYAISGKRHAERE
jgi:hypothetical protein